ncbi:NAD(P)H-binding protein [Paenibacillus sp. J5C_2022]|uniref:NAD(P)H-binding protein n=1 Tax=Paenibacillus sp. J5C2022 TaxID=2977129 RepID=UPI0021CE32A5|nr:NAD(P)H-binding protein [Paenibacillus sp. J5C2022]MCU6707259.1 NAD(P)H-binding protein [Paenibacillus sp. J5C2022]
MSTKTALLAGATGLVGGHLLHRLLNIGVYGQVTILVRKPLKLQHPKLRQVAVDYDQLDQYREDIEVDDIYCCLGTTIKKAGSQAAFRKVDYEYPLHIAKLAHSKSVKKLVMVTSIGANAQSAFFYTRVKGEVEAAILRVGLPSVHFLHPSQLLGARQEKRPAEKAAIALSPLLKLFTKGKLSKYTPIQAQDVALAMIGIGQSAPQGNHVYEYEQIMRFAHGKNESVT